MKSRTYLLLSLFVVVIVMNTSVVLAQHDQSSSQGPSSDMMQACRNHRSAMSSLIDRTSKTLLEARELGSVEEMRAAIDKAQSQLAEMKHNMSMGPMAQARAPEDANEHKKGMKCVSGGQDGEGKEPNSKLSTNIRDWLTGELGYVALIEKQTSTEKRALWRKPWRKTQTESQCRVDGHGCALGRCHGLLGIGWVRQVQCCYRSDRGSWRWLFLGPNQHPAFQNQQ